MSEYKIKNEQERITYLESIENSEKNENSRYRLFFKGNHKSFFIYRIHIGIPVYRLKNGRTITRQEEFVKTENKNQNFFQNNESKEAQKAQHEILKKMIHDEGLTKNLEKSRRQEEPIILDYRGIIINGNRRVCSIRNQEIKGFEYIECIILPKSTTPEEIDALENELQIKQNTKSPYEWTATAKRTHNYIKKEYSYREISEKMGIEEDKIKELNQMYIWADEFLKKIGKEKEWSQIKDDEQSFKELIKHRAKKNFPLKIKIISQI